MASAKNKYKSYGIRITHHTATRSLLIASRYLQCDTHMLDLKKIRRLNEMWTHEADRGNPHIMTAGTNSHEKVSAANLLRIFLWTQLRRFAK